MATAADPRAGCAGPWRIARAPAKINLGLRVVGRRADGYRLLDSLVAFAGFGDHVAVAPRPDDGGSFLALRGPFARALADAGSAGNLATAAADRFRGVFGGPPIDIVLWKRLPVAAGVGGGSADAAAILRLMAGAAGVATDDPRLLDLALALGADVPMCLASRTARAAGVGERLTPAPRLPPLPVVLANPGFALATPAVFNARQGGCSEPAALAEGYDDIAAAAAALEEFGNDLTAPAIGLAPALAGVLAALQASAGCRFAGMSGSGATCFALYDTPAAARAAAVALAAERRGWWTVATALNAG